MLEFTRELLEGSLNANSNQLNPEQEDFLQAIERFIFYGESTYAADILAEMMKDKELREAGVMLLEKAGRLSETKDSFLLKKCISTEFARPVQEYARSIRAFHGDSTHEDYSAFFVFSIDDEETREVDDAIGVEKDGEDTLVYVHIADPALFISKDDAVDQAARKRSLSLYLPTATVPMLPERIGCDLASLSENEYRPALSFCIRFDPEYNIRDWSLTKGQICLDQRLSYNDAEQLMEKPDGNSDSVATKLQELSRIAETRRKVRFDHGAIQITRPEVKISVDAKGAISVKTLTTNSPARRMVEEVMILTNHLTGQYAVRKNIPIIYRTQPPPTEERVGPIYNYDPIQFDNTVRALRPSKLSTHPGRHASLGVDVYTQATSPLRRCADMVVQRQIDAYLRGKPFPYEAQELIEILRASEETQKENRKLEKEAVDMWLLEYLRRHYQDRALNAIVVSDTPDKKIELVEFPLRGKLTTGNSYSVGTQIRVYIAEIDPEKCWVVFKP